MQIENKLEYISNAHKQRGEVDYLVNCDGFNPMTQVLAHLLEPRMVSGGVIEKMAIEYWIGVLNQNKRY